MKHPNITTRAGEVAEVEIGQPITGMAMTQSPYGFHFAIVRDGVGLAMAVMIA